MEKNGFIEVKEVKVVKEEKVLKYQEFVAIMAAYIHRIYFDGNNGKDLTLRAEDYEWKLSKKEEFDKVCSDVVKRLYKITVDD
jgi:hypothetical protein